MRGLIALLVSVLLLAACAATPAPPSFEPAAEFGAGEPAATAESGGIVVELWLDRRQVNVGDLVHALVRVSNHGDQVISRETNTCGAGPAGTTVVRSGDEIGTEGPAGREWEGIAADFKRLVLGKAGLGDGPRQIGSFWDARLQGEEVGCLLISKVGPFAPGSVDELVVAWRAVAGEGEMLVPGPATVRATFVEAAHHPIDGPLLEVTAEAPIEIVAPDGAAAEPIGPTLVDYVDAALSEPAFTAWLEAAPPETWMGASVNYWPTPEGSYPGIPPFDRFGRRPVVVIDLHRRFPDGDPRGVLVPEGEVRSVIIDRQTLAVLSVHDPMRGP